MTKLDFDVKHSSKPCFNAAMFNTYTSSPDTECVDAEFDTNTPFFLVKGGIRFKPVVAAPESPNYYQARVKIMGRPDYLTFEVTAVTTVRKKQRVCSYTRGLTPVAFDFNFVTA